MFQRPSVARAGEWVKEIVPLMVQTPAPVACAAGTGPTSGAIVSPSSNATARFTAPSLRAGRWYVDAGEARRQVVHGQRGAAHGQARVLAGGVGVQRHVPPTPAPVGLERL